VSPSWRERLLIDIAAQHVGVRRYSRGWRPRLLGASRAPLRSADADGVAQALVDAMPASGARPADAEVVLSADWVRFAVLDAAASLRGADERSAAARHALRRVYGEGAAHWRVSASLSGSDSLLAAGIEQALFDRIAQALTAGGATLVSVQPSLTGALNHCRRWLDRPSWFVLLEPGRALQCFSDGKQLRSVRSHRVRHAVDDELQDWLEQGRLVDGLAEPDTALVLAYRDTAAPKVPSMNGRVRLVDLDAALAA
jgi:hypothetical protein